MLPLRFADDFLLLPLGSGSSGNCTWIGNHKRGVLIDCGVSTKQIRERMAAAGLQEATVLAVLLTHEHADHVAHAGVLSRHLLERQGSCVPFYATAGTIRRLPPRANPELLLPLQPGQSFPVGPLVVEPFSVPHDTADPVGFAVAQGAHRAAVITDLGRPTRLVEQVLASVDLALVEFNHDPELLMDGPYPWALKQRVRGPHGHLSNLQAAELVSRGASPRLRHLHLGHLSEQNNRPELALQEASRGLALAQRRVPLTIALPDAATEPSCVPGPASSGPASNVSPKRPSLPGPLFGSA